MLAILYIVPRLKIAKLESMAYLKAAGKAIRNSPKAIRKKFGHGGGGQEVQKHERELLASRMNPLS